MCLALERKLDELLGLENMDQVQSSWKFEPGALGSYAVDVFDLAAKHRIDLRTIVDDEVYERVLRHAAEAAHENDEAAHLFLSAAGAMPQVLEGLDPSYIETIQARSRQYRTEH